MNNGAEQKGSKPVQLIKALWGCALLFCIPGLVLTFVAPSSVIELTRADEDRVDVTVFKKVLFVVPISEQGIAGLLVPNSRVIDGGAIRERRTPTGKIIGEAEDEGLLILEGPGGESIEVYISPKNLDDTQDEIQYFLTDGNDPSLRLWVVANWKFGAILPGAILVFCLVIFLIASWSIMTGKPLASEGTSA
ncbi:MAG: hypothetical protein GY851_35780 [bacterium]|nr:hypothetical protein [bacterium]